MVESLGWLRDYALVEIRNVAPQPSGNFSAMVVPWRGDRSTPPAHEVGFTGWLAEGSLGLFDLKSGRGVDVRPWIAIRNDRAGPATPHLVLTLDLAGREVELSDPGSASSLRLVWTPDDAMPLHVDGGESQRLIEDRTTRQSGVRRLATEPFESSPRRKRRIFTAVIGLVLVAVPLL